MSVSRNRKVPPEKWRTDVRFARISYTEDGGAVCTCRWTARRATRTKVLEDSIDRHLLKRHGGMGFRL